MFPEEKEKRAPAAVDFSMLDNSQMQFVEEAMDYISTPYEECKYMIFVLMGYAGTGKSFVNGKLQEWCVYCLKKTVNVTAPTNKAVDVCRNMSDIESNLIKFSTLHKLLALKESYDQYGRLKFLPDNKDTPSIESVDILFVDETSMLDDSLFEYLLPYIKKGLKIIFVGDPAQIPPINRLACIPFNQKKQREHKMHVFSLTEIHRQQEGNPVLELATAVRQNIDSQIIPFDFETKIVNGGGIIVQSRDDQKMIYKICDVYFANDRFSQYSDYMKIIAYRNVTVNAVNNKVRKIIFNKPELPKIMPGEKLLANEPIKDPRGYFIYSTNAEFEVVGYEVREISVNVVIGGTLVFKQECKYYATIVKGTVVSDKKNFNKPKVIWIIHEDSEQDFAQNLENTKAEILKLGHFERLSSWQHYYKAKETFASVKYNYAITAHKAQGSSYENCMVIDWDIETSNKIAERNRIRYVAFTRTRNYLFLIR